MGLLILSGVVYWHHHHNASVLNPNNMIASIPQYKPNDVSKRLDEIGKEIDQGNYNEASVEMKEIYKKYPHLYDDEYTYLCGAEISRLFNYKSKIYQHIGNLAHDTFMVEGTVISKSDMEGSGSFWEFSLRDRQGQIHNFNCGEANELYFNVDNNMIDYLDGYGKLKNTYDKAKIYIMNSDKSLFNKCKNKDSVDCDGKNLCPVAIVMLSNGTAQK